MNSATSPAWLWVALFAFSFVLAFTCMSSPSALAQSEKSADSGTVTQQETTPTGRSSGDETIKQDGEARPAQPQKKEVTEDYSWLASDKWQFRFEFNFLTILFLLITWVAGVMWVSKSTQRKRIKHDFWTLLAVVGFLPGVLVYVIVQLFPGLNPPKPPPKEAVAAPVKRRKIPLQITPQTEEAAIPDSGDNATSIGPSIEIIGEDGRPKLVMLGEGGERVLLLLRWVLEQALDNGASDVHLEPALPDYQCRFRIDGEFRRTESLPMAAGMSLISGLKTIAGIEALEQRSAPAHSGMFRVRLQGSELDLRVATSRGIYGETMVLRMLQLGLADLDLLQVGLSEADEKVIRTALARRTGTIIVAGPSGSGKTTTAYAMLKAFNPREKKVVTIEDPVEYRLIGATQISVDPERGITYERELQNILRQDPDVIFVGEIRNREAAEATISSSTGGRLVITTMQAASAAGAIERLRDMGIDHYRLSSALSVVSSQRLMRRICASCSEAYTPSEDELRYFGAASSQIKQLWKGTGCKKCGMSGLYGRVGIFEVLPLTHEVRSAVNGKLPPETITEFGRDAGMHVLWEDALSKVAQGIISLEEASKLE